MFNAMQEKEMFYIGQRNNPQLKAPYYKAFGKLSKKDAKTKEQTAYGSMYLTGYSTEAEYLAAIEQLKQSGAHFV